MNQFHEVNEIYDGTLDHLHHFLYSTGITTNETFTFCGVMKQEDRLSFVEAMEKKIRDHEEGGHWTVVHHSTLPNKSLPIKSIWSFNNKRKPHG